MQTTALQIWMEELFNRDENGAFITGLPSTGDSRWVVRRKHVVRAVSHAANSMPGPDGIPAAAYRALGPLAIDLLFQVTKGLCSQGCAEELRRAYSDRSPPGTHLFNHSLLCCLPKKTQGQKMGWRSTTVVTARAPLP